MRRRRYAASCPAWLAALLPLAAGCIQTVGTARAPWNLTDPPYRSPYGQSLLSPVPAAPRTTLRPSPVPSAPQQDPLPPPQPRIEPVPEPPASSGGPRLVPPGEAADARMELTIDAPARRQIGSEILYRIGVTNAGAADADDVVIVADIDEGLAFSSRGERSVRQPLGRLAPGEHKEVVLSLFADRTGTRCARFRVTVESYESASESTCVEIVPRELDVAIVGPPDRPVGGRAEYTFKVSNTSGRPLRSVRVTAGYEAAMAPREGSAGAVPGPQSLTWDLGDLKPAEGAQLQVEFECRSESGAACVSFEVAADGLPMERLQRCLRIDPAPREVEFAISDTADPIAVGDETAYEVTVRNRGLEALRDTRLTVLLPPAVRFVSAEMVQAGQTTPVPLALQDGESAFPPVESLAADATLTYRVRVAGARPGDGAFTARLEHAAAPAPLELIEPTTVNP